MDSTRTRREIKTPKRFDEEAFETPTRVQRHSAPPAPKPVGPPTTPSSPKQVKIAPEPSKSVFKVKLAPPRPKLATKETPIKQKEATPKPKETPPKPRESAAKQKVEVPIKQKDTTTKLPKETPVKPKEPITKPKEPPAKQRESTVRQKDVTVRQREPSIRQKEVVNKHKESTVKVKQEHTPHELKPIEREGPINFRPRNVLQIQTPPTFADLIPNVVLPFWDARTAAEEHEDDNVKELVHCHCGITEELGLMVQCETCLTWQHAHCLGIDKPEDAPDGYTCKACSDPRYARESMKWAYDQDWLTKGRMKQFSCDSNLTSESDIRILHQINRLIESVLYIHRLLHSIKVKSRILMKASDDDPDLKLFRIQWPVNYQHRDGSMFIPTVNQPSSTPASTISAIGDTPDPGDIAVETVADVLPEIGQLDVSAILDNTDVPEPQPTPQTIANNQESTPNDCRANLRLHIQQTEEFIGLELSSIEEQLSALDKECTIIYRNDGRPSDWGTSLDSLKNDLMTMKKYILLKKQRLE